MTLDGPIGETPAYGSTRQIDAELEAVLDRYEQAVEAGESVDIELFCSQLPGREEEVRSVLESMRATARRLQNDARPQQPGVPESLVGNSVTAASRVSRLKFHARGGLGSVLKGHDEDLGRDVAVKIIAEGRHHDSESRERFLREAEVTGRLRHPGIVPVYSRGDAVDGRPFYVMPFLDEGTLDQAIKTFHDDRGSYRANDPQFRDLLGHYIAACKTVAYAHSRGVVHRDLKPQNIMLGRYGETLVIDWGAAEKSRREERDRLKGETSIDVRGSSSQSNSSGVFTPQYASPEQMEGNMDLGPATDVYSLGVVLYKLVCGATPLVGTTQGALRKACLNGEFRPPRERHQSVPRALDAICLRAMQTDPRDRYASPEDIAIDVEAFLADAPVSAVPEKLMTRAARLVRREWPAVMATMAGLLLVALIALVTAARQGSLKADARTSSRSRLQLAATLAAKAGGGEIDRRWRYLEQEAASPTIRNTVAELNDAWDDQAGDWTDQDSVENLQSRLTDLYFQARDAAQMQFVAVLVQGVDGRILSRVPRDEVIGKVYAYRHYFHGQVEDLSIHASPPPAEGVVLSNVFLSTSTHQPHMTISVPIRGPYGSGNETDVIGRLSMSMLVGQIDMFDDVGADEVPLLVEARKYKWGERNSFGVILHHPNLQVDETLTGEAAAASLPVIPEETMTEIVTTWQEHRRADQQMTAASIPEFIDPVKGDVTEVAFAPVMIKGRPEFGRSVGWYVLLYPRPTEGE